MTEECEHSNRVYCQRTFTNGSIHVGTTCLNCGDFRAVKKDSIPQLERNNLRDYDPAIKDAYHMRQRDQYRLQAQLTQQEILTENRQTMNGYYDSDQWKQKRKFRLQINDRIHFGLCEVCSKNRATDIHHITYARFGNEWLFDLAAICHGCHESLHLQHMQE